MHLARSCHVSRIFVSKLSFAFSLFVDRKGPHKSGNRGRHYTVYGLSLVIDVDYEAYRKRWVLHVNVDDEDIFTGSCFEKSTKTGRRYDLMDANMNHLSVSDSFLSASKSY